MKLRRKGVGELREAESQRWMLQKSLRRPQWSLRGPAKLRRLGERRRLRGGEGSSGSTEREQVEGKRGCELTVCVSGSVRGVSGRV
jgi:hypothetical protein